MASIESLYGIMKGFGKSMISFNRGMIGFSGYFKHCSEPSRKASMLSYAGGDFFYTNHSCNGCNQTISRMERCGILYYLGGEIDSYPDGVRTSFSIAIHQLNKC